jgi:vanillate O-demethylase ferredoxin subunit
MDSIEARLTQIRHEANGIASFEFTPLDGKKIASIDPGSHIDIHIGPRLIRQYSLINSPVDRNCYRIAVQREDQGRGGSLAMHRELSIDTEVKLSFPRNNFAMDFSANRKILLAGGIGITPLLSMALYCDRKKLDFELHYSTRSADRAAFSSLLTKLSRKSSVNLYHDETSESQHFNPENVLADCDADAHVYICGPAGFIDACYNSALKVYSDECIHIERFTAAVAKDSEAVGDTPDQGFNVILQKSNLEVWVSPEQTLLDAVMDAGVDLPFSCEQGICGTCITRVIKGKPDHRDAYLNDQEKASNQSMALCVSRCHGDEITLDI